MSHADYDKSVIRNIILRSQHLIKKSSESIEDIVSDICGLQYDPNPTIHLNPKFPEECIYEGEITAKVSSISL